MNAISLPNVIFIVGKPTFAKIFPQQSFMVYACIDETQTTFYKFIAQNLTIRNATYLLVFVGTC